MYCSSCGKQLDPTSRFCPSCGNVCTPSYGPGYYPPRTPITRPREPRAIAGVCSGFALHYGWDVAIVRIVTLVTAIFTGIGFVAYLVAWIVIPETPYALPAPPPPPAGTSESTSTLA
jgi:phage shock protein C